MAAAALAWFGGSGEAEGQVSAIDGVPPLPPAVPDTAPPLPLGESLSVPPVQPFSPPPMQPYALPAAENLYAAEQPTLEAAAEEAAAEGEPRRYLMELFGAEQSKFQVYGWIQNSFTANPAFPSDGINFGVTPNYASNDWRGNQYYTVFERPLDHDGTINFGGRLDFLFGHDHSFNHMRGVFDNAFGPTQFAGIDLAQFYGEVHLPVLTEGGLDVKFGRWYTLHGYEVVPAIGRPLLSVPYMFTFGQPFTHWGLMTTWNVSDNLVIYNGSPQGWDDFQNRNLVWTYMGGFSYTGLQDKLNLTFVYSYAVNQFHKQEVQLEGGPLIEASNIGYTGNFTHLWTTVLSYQWTDRLTQVLENDIGYEEDVPFDAGGGVVGHAPSRWTSFGNWFLYELGDNLTGVWRSEIFWDNDGFRTGFADRYYEQTLGLIYKPCPNLWIRPETRWDWAQFGTPYNGGVSGSQFTYGFDIILLY
ncbi:hypothetical protein TsocGM_12260 [Tautonia sociabilis]|uniref:Porin n=2 Tax=Tautonia sociabilis TaxID=2080755 RepID=A0A432MJZ2_9BACT|nr:hypothetical protein TsocGM_12260 [Tautonia sociabilis]